MSKTPGGDSKNTLYCSFCGKSQHEVRKLIAEGVIKDGMIPKVESCINALQSGVRKIHIIAAAMPHALLLEIFTAEGIGTELLP